MFLFIFESIGTSELILIAVVALIVFGPRKLPQMAKTIGKTMADFRNATNEFKSTWEKEVSFEDEEKNGFEGAKSITDAAISRDDNIEQTSSQSISENSENQFSPPSIQEISASDFADKIKDKEENNQIADIKEKVSEKKNNKRDWL